MRRRRRIAGGALVISAALLAASPAAADIGVVKVRPNVAAPDTPIEITIGCGSSRCPTRLPVSLAPLAQAPKPHPCGTNALCSPEANGPPRSPPYLFLGWAGEQGSPPVGKQYQLRTRVPRVRPGTYAFVIFAGARNLGSRGFLIANTAAPHMLLHVRAEQSSSEGSRTNTAWWVAGAAALIAVAAVAGLLLRRRSA